MTIEDLGNQVYRNSRIKRNTRRNNRVRERRLVKCLVDKYGTCCYCDRPVSYEECTIEHIECLSQCLTKGKKRFNASNVEAACIRCNTTKKDQTLEQFAAWRMIWIRKWVGFKHSISSRPPPDEEFIEQLHKRNESGRALRPLYLQRFHEVIQQYDWRKAQGAD